MLLYGIKIDYYHMLINIDNDCFYECLKTFL